MKNQTSKLTEQERALLDEYIFYLFIHKVYSTDNPIDASKFIDSLCAITKCNKHLINTAVSDVLSGIRECKPRKCVYIYLLGKCMSVRKVCAFLGISMTTYYDALHDVKEIYLLPKPFWDEITHTEVVKLLTQLSDILPLRRCY